MGRITDMRDNYVSGNIFLAGSPLQIGSQGANLLGYRSNVMKSLIPLIFHNFGQSELGTSNFVNTISETFATNTNLQATSTKFHNSGIQAITATEHIEGSEFPDSGAEPNASVWTELVGDGGYISGRLFMDTPGNGVASIGTDKDFAAGPDFTIKMRLEDEQDNSFNVYIGSILLASGQAIDTPAYITVTIDNSSGTATAYRQAGSSYSGTYINGAQNVDIAGLASGPIIVEGSNRNASPTRKIFVEDFMFASQGSLSIIDTTGTTVSTGSPTEWMLTFNSGGDQFISGVLFSSDAGVNYTDTVQHQINWMSGGEEGNEVRVRFAMEPSGTKMRVVPFVSGLFTIYNGQ